MNVDEAKCDLCGTTASPGAAYCVACGEILKRKTSSSQGSAKKMVTIGLTEHALEKINELRGGVSISDYIAKLIEVHLKKQTPLPEEVIDMALVD